MNMGENFIQPPRHIRSYERLHATTQDGNVADETPMCVGIVRQPPQPRKVRSDRAMHTNHTDTTTLNRFNNKSSRNGTLISVGRKLKSLRPHRGLGFFRGCLIGSGERSINPYAVYQPHSGGGG